MKTCEQLDHLNEMDRGHDRSKEQDMEIAEALHLGILKDPSAKTDVTHSLHSVCLGEYDDPASLIVRRQKWSQGTMVNQDLFNLELHHREQRRLLLTVKEMFGDMMADGNYPELQETPNLKGNK